MERYLEFPIGRLWRLTVRKQDVRNEYIVPDVHLADLINSVAWDRGVQDLHCVPYDCSAHDGVWMTSRAVVEAAV
ncbi:hypothetical protein GCM10023322_16840 [Rugosimonospora acidiphila]|uniref:Uncharacterized protein n=1 Tax=Rugosimonospora acidiphila TaxID=556531 RepID=A0ABP9RPC3_9ACTN